jgi:hypothetical protein
MLVSDYAILTASYGSSSAFFTDALPLSHNAPPAGDYQTSSASIAVAARVEFTAPRKSVYMSVDHQRIMMKALRSSVRVVGRRR